MNTHIDLTDFLNSDWQNRPVILRGALTDFQNPIEPDELAGLAAEDFVESRVIYHNGNEWSALSGPFADYEKFGREQWTLVVQAVNHWHAPAQAFADAFYQLPMWQFDDVMVSYATEGGGVGPHRDRYDTFICQGSGTRRWRVGDKNACIKDVIAHKKLLHVEAFTPIIDAVLETGDVLYIPAGFPHEGVSLGESMSFSVGLQSINSTQLLSDFADYVIDAQSSGKFTPNLYQHADRNVRGQTNTLSQADLVGLKAFLQQAISDEAKLSDFFGKYFSESRHELNMPLVEHIEPISNEDLLAKLANTPLIKVDALKCLSIEAEPSAIFVNGERYNLTPNSPAFIDVICTQSHILPDDLPAIEGNISTLTEWVNLGFYYFEE